MFFYLNQPQAISLYLIRYNIPKQDRHGMMN